MSLSNLNFDYLDYLNNLINLPIVLSYGEVTSGPVPVEISPVMESLFNYPSFINNSMEIYAQLIPVNYGSVATFPDSNPKPLIEVLQFDGAMPDGSIMWDNTNTKLLYKQFDNNDNGITYLVNLIIKY
jgi:hypothetical protein